MPIDDCRIFSLAAPAITMVAMVAPIDAASPADSTTRPVFTITVICPGASPEAVEADVTKPIEVAVNALRGIRRIRSNSWEGMSQTYVELDPAANFETQERAIREAVIRLTSRLPASAGTAVFSWAVH